jgi:hypothetical protein
MKVRKRELAAALALGGSAVFLGWYRPWQLAWGTSRAEASGPMPGDDVVPRPTFSATRAVTVSCPPEAIWPWIVQIGFGRAGWYSYDLLDNLGRRSAQNLIPEFQHLEVGDLVPLGPGKNSGMRVKDFDAGRWIVWWDDKLRLTSWTWQLTAMPGGTTRLVTRVRSRSAWRHPSTAVWRVLSEVADFPMMRGCLLGIKRRAEASWPQERVSQGERVATPGTSPQRRASVEGNATLHRPPIAAADSPHRHGGPR